MSTPLCILLVDDSNFFLELERHFLRNTKAEILTAKNAAEALAMVREYRPSLVFMDIDMPVMDGMEACRTLKSDPELKEIPLVLIGDHKQPEQAAAAKQAKADAYLCKPLDRRLFLDTGHSFLVSIDRREARQSHNLEVVYLYRGRQLKGHCLDLSSGGLFLACPPTARKGELLLLDFVLPDARRRPVNLQGRVAWVNDAETLIKPDFPYGFGVEFVEISDSAGIALRRFFGT